MSEDGSRTSFNRGNGSSAIEGKVARVAMSEGGSRASFKPRRSRIIDCTHAAAGGTRCPQRVRKEMLLWPPNICAYRESLAIVFSRSRSTAANKEQCSSICEKEKVNRG